MQEGERKGFADLPVDEIQRVGEVCLKANKYKDDINKSLSQIKDGRENVKMEKLLKLNEEANKLMINMEEISNLKAVITEVRKYEIKC